MIKKITSIIASIFIIIISLILVSNLYQKYILKEKMPMFLGYGYGMILSGSMEPSLSINDLIIVKEKDSYNVGDIVVFENGNILTTHRIISQDINKIITKGDANNTEDNPINPSAIKGKLVHSISNFKQKEMLLKIVLIIIGITLIATNILKKEEQTK